MPGAAGGLPCINICSACFVLHPSVPCHAGISVHLFLLTCFNFPSRLQAQGHITRVEQTLDRCNVDNSRRTTLLILGDNWMTSLGKKHEVLDSVYPCQNCPLSKLASSTASQSQSELSSKASQPISNFQLTTLSSTLAGHHSKNS